MLRSDLMPMNTASLVQTALSAFRSRHLQQFCQTVRMFGHVINKRTIITNQTEQASHVFVSAGVIFITALTFWS